MSTKTQRCESFIVKKKERMRLKRGIDYLIIWKKLNGIQSDDERKILEAWLQDSPKNRNYYSGIIQNYEKEALDITIEEVRQAWNQLRVQTADRPQRKWLKVAQVIAAVVLPVAVTLSFLVLSKDRVDQELKSYEIQPGQSKAILQTERGQSIVLDQDHKVFIENKAGVIIGADSLNVLRYSSHQKTNQLEYNTIKVPRGGEYQLVLSDGTKVWLNSETVLTYPVTFIGDKREVKLVGEALFKVSENNQKPFFVQTTHSKVKVYGTTFNVMSYPDDQEEQTTLVEGSVAIIYDNEEVKIKPGEQGKIDKKQRRLLVHQVDTALYTAWRDGIFRFEDMTLEALSVKLARWYDVEFFFSGEKLKNKRFTGAVKRETDFEFFLNLISETTKVDISINDNAVLVRARY